MGPTTDDSPPEPPMNLDQLLDTWRTNPQRRRNIVHWQTQEAVEAE